MKNFCIFACHKKRANYFKETWKNYKGESIVNITITIIIKKKNWIWLKSLNAKLF